MAWRGTAWHSMGNAKHAPQLSIQPHSTLGCRRICAYCVVLCVGEQALAGRQLVPQAVVASTRDPCVGSLHPPIGRHTLHGLQRPSLMKGTVLIGQCLSGYCGRFGRLGLAVHNGSLGEPALGRASQGDCVGATVVWRHCLQ